MTAYEFAGYAFLAFLSLCFVSGLALYRHRGLTSPLAKMGLWFVPSVGAGALILLLYAAFGTKTGGYPLFHYGIVGAGCQLLTVTLPVLQAAVILIAGKLNR